MKKLLLLATLAAAALAAAGAASADPGSRAVVEHSSGCTVTPLAIVCADLKTTTNVTVTPSGNLSYVTNGIVETTMTFPAIGCTYTRSQPLHLHTLQKAGEPHNESLRIVTTTHLDCGSGYAPTCTTTLQRHAANGEVQFGRWEAVCTTP